MANPRLVHRSLGGVDGLWSRAKRDSLLFELSRRAGNVDGWAPGCSSDQVRKRQEYHALPVEVGTCMTRYWWGLPGAEPEAASLFGGRTSASGVPSGVSNVRRLLSLPVAAPVKDNSRGWPLSQEDAAPIVLPVPYIPLRSRHRRTTTCNPTFKTLVRIARRGGRLRSWLAADALCGCSVEAWRS